ncbi:uncharacterized protein LOC144180664 [Haemaphysalis longicornis]
MARTAALVLLLVAVHVLSSASSPASSTATGPTSLAGRTAALRRLRRDVEAKTASIDRVVCILLEVGSSWCERGIRDSALELKDRGDVAEDELREMSILPCSGPACKLFAKRNKSGKRRPPDQSPDSQFYSGW